MGKIGKITSIKKEYSGEYKQTLAGSLAAAGYGRFPGSKVTFVPRKDTNGEYKTGLNPDALYIKQLMKINPEEAEQEITRVTALRDELEAMTGLDLSSRSEYYSKMYDGDYDQANRAKVVKLKDGVNIFNLDDPYESITYAWLRVHDDIAPSMEAYRTGKIRDIQDVFFYVDDFDFEVEQEHTKKVRINKAIAALEAMSTDRQYKVARLLSLPVRADDKPSAIYNAIDNFVKAAPKSGTSTQNITLFEKIVNMADNNFHVRYTIEEALKYTVLREKAKLIYEGETVIAKNKEELINNYSIDKNQEDLIALEEKVRQRKTAEKA